MVTLGLGRLFIFRGKEARKLTWLKKDAVVKGYEVSTKNEEGEDFSYHCHKACLPKEGDHMIREHITKETLDARRAERLLCDLCGEEIE
jgi:hypothetical protein